MKILPRQQDILKSKNDERKKEIDSGIALATRIDKLRETMINEERQLGVWRENSIRLIQKDIDDYITVKENLKIQTEEAEIHRRKLLEPLDNEWQEINREKIKINKELNDNVISKEEIIQERKELEKDREKLSELIIKAKDNEKDTEKAKNQSSALKDMAQREFEKAREEHEAQTELHERKLLDLSSREREYESGIKINALEEKRLQDFEKELITKEAQLQDREQTLERELRRIKNVN